RKIAALAELKHKQFSPHTWGNGLGLLANLHLAASVPNCTYIEYPYHPPSVVPEAYYGFLATPLTVDRDGYLPLPQGPGLGVELDRKALQQYRVE
ncbi:MAG: mandelate racemase/muconate lactonizing enzyme family protein, partial [Deinococcus sp.]|nr:mandelate racemase/muconate lactonizing enzyme family protein [Deinococcus sp.]